MASARRYSVEELPRHWRETWQLGEPSLFFERSPGPFVTLTAEGRKQLKRIRQLEGVVDRMPIGGVGYFAALERVVLRAQALLESMPAANTLESNALRIAVREALRVKQ